MTLNPRIGALVTAGTLAVAVPALAHPGPATHPTKPSHPSHSHRCAPHKAAYVESGTVDATTASTLAKNADGTWTGTLVVDVTRANHHAKGDKKTTVTVTFTSATLHVKFDGGTTGFTAGERVKLIGKLATVAKKCPALSPPATPVFRMVVVHPAPTPKS
jgi:hypothetical protein